MADSSSSKSGAIGCGVLLIAGIIAFAACSAGDSGSSSGGGAPAAAAPAGAPSPGAVSPAQMLADLDQDQAPVTEYQKALDALAPKCSQDPARLAAIANATLTELGRAHITDETELSVLQHLDQSVPDGSSKMDCQDVAAAYLTLRESPAN